MRLALLHMDRTVKPLLNQQLKNAFMAISNEYILEMMRETRSRSRAALKLTSKVFNSDANTDNHSERDRKLSKRTTQNSGQNILVTNLIDVMSLPDDPPAQQGGSDVFDHKQPINVDLALKSNLITKTHEFGTTQKAQPRKLPTACEDNGPLSDGEDTERQLRGSEASSKNLDLHEFGMRFRHEVMPTNTSTLSQRSHPGFNPEEAAEPSQPVTSYVNIIESPAKKHPRNPKAILKGLTQSPALRGSYASPTKTSANRKEGAAMASPSKDAITSPVASRRARPNPAKTTAFLKEKK